MVAVDDQRTTSAGRLNVIEVGRNLAHGDVQIASLRRDGDRAKRSFRRLANVEQRQRLTAVETLTELPRRKLRNGSGRLGGRWHEGIPEGKCWMADGRWQISFVIRLLPFAFRHPPDDKRHCVISPPGGWRSRRACCADRVDVVGAVLGVVELDQEGRALNPISMRLGPIGRTGPGELDAFRTGLADLVEPGLGDLAGHVG